MSRVVRPSTPEDGPAIVALLEQAGLKPSHTAAHLYWKYWQVRTDLPEPRSWVLVDSGQVIAHAAAIHNTCLWEGGRIRTIHMIDWAARPGAVGAGAALMKYVGTQTQALLAIGGSADTVGILPHIGFRPIGEAKGFVRTLFPLRFLRGVEDRTWRLIPRLVRYAAWAVAAPSPRSSMWCVRRISAEEVTLLTPVLPTPTGRRAALLERTVSQLTDMLTCPIVPIQLFSVENANGIGGYFLLASAPGQVRIVDCWMQSGDAADWHAMILCAVAQAMHDPQAAEVVIWASDPLLDAVLPACGFHARSTMRIQLRSVGGLSIPSPFMRVQMLDTDAPWLHHDETQFAA